MHIYDAHLPFPDVERCEIQQQSHLVVKTACALKKDSRIFDNVFVDILAQTVDKMDKVFFFFFREKIALGETWLNTINMTIVYRKMSIDVIY